jgi:hypothetical protein
MALWAYNDAGSPHLDTLLNSDVAIAILDVDDEDYDDLDDLEIGERAVKEMNAMSANGPAYTFKNRNIYRKNAG